jgi:glycosyltransferase involved in cell wall biosynthesis
MRNGEVPMVAPAPSVAENYTKLAPELSAHLHVIPHGTRPIVDKPLRFTPSSSDFRVIILGVLAPNKGLELFREVRAQLSTIAKIFLVGSGPEGKAFSSARITVVPQYEWEKLPEILAGIRPNVGLLLSQVPETFSYTLQELLELGIPTVATRIGSFQDRIEHGVNGFLCEPTADGVLRCLRELVEDTDLLQRVHTHLCRSRFRTVTDMLEDYEVLLKSNAPSAAAYFCSDLRKGNMALPESQELDRNRDRLFALAEADVRHLQQIMAGMLHSRSWKVTLPMRAAVQFARKTAALPKRVMGRIMRRPTTIDPS